MVSNDAQWTELVVDCPASDQTKCIVETIGPFLKDWSFVPDRRGHFIPDPETGRICVYVVSRATPADDSALGIFGRHLRGPSMPLVARRGVRTDIHEVQIQGRAARDLVDDFLIDSTPLVLELLEKILRQPSERTERAFELMGAQPLVLASRLFPQLQQLGFPIAFISYRSHVDGFLLMTRAPERTKHTFEERYQRAAAAAERSLRSTAAQLTNGRVESEPLRAWIALLDDYLGRTLAGLRSGALLTSMGAETGSIGDNFDLAVSAFHQAVHADPQFRARVALDPEFNAMRVVASLLYLTLHRIGVRLIDRYMLCYTVARTFERVYDVSSTAALRAFAAALAEARPNSLAAGA